MPDSPGLDTNSNMRTTRRNSPHRLHERDMAAAQLDQSRECPGLVGRSSGPPGPGRPFRDRPLQVPLRRSYAYTKKTGVMRGYPDCDNALDRTGIGNLFFAPDKYSYRA